MSEIKEELNGMNENTATEEKALPSLANATPRELADAVVAVLDAKKGHDIQLLHVEKKTIIADYFVLCTGNSSTQVKALTDEVDYQLGLRGVQPNHVEGRGNATWEIIDYASVIVHVFSREARQFYNIEKLYEDAEKISE